MKVRRGCLDYLASKADLDSPELLASEVRTAGQGCLALRAGREILDQQVLQERRG